MAFSRNGYVRVNAKLLTAIVCEQSTNLRLIYLYYFIVSSACWNQLTLSGYIYFQNSFGPDIKKLFSFVDTLNIFASGSVPLCDKTADSRQSEEKDGFSTFLVSV